MSVGFTFNAEIGFGTIVFPGMFALGSGMDVSPDLSYFVQLL